nr:hypothetical protein [Tanacetum cinerariifolium]
MQKVRKTVGNSLVFIVEENRVTRPKKYSELSATEAIQADCNVKATNIIFQGLLPKVYALVSNHKVTKELWEKIQLLMQGTSLTKQERECKLYDEFDKFAYKKGESLRDFYLRFSLLLNDMNIYNMKLEQFRVNTKFLNSLPPEWSKFVTDVKLVRDLHTTNVDQLHAYLGQHEYHVNEVRLMHERNSDPLALVANHQMTNYGRFLKDKKKISQAVNDGRIKRRRGLNDLSMTKSATKNISCLKRPKEGSRGSSGEKFIGQGEQVLHMLDKNKEETSGSREKPQKELIPTPRAWRLYMGREASKEGSDVGMILVSPKEKVYSYVIHINFYAFEDSMDYEALLAGLVASVDKGMKDLHVEGSRIPRTKEVESQEPRKQRST